MQRLAFPGSRAPSPLGLNAVVPLPAANPDHRPGFSAGSDLSGGTVKGKPEDQVKRLCREP